MYNLNGKVAIVTASAGAGIGQATAKKLASEGASVVIADMNEGRSTKTAERFQQEGFSAIGIPCDVSQYSQVQNLVERTIEAFGGIDILVNNAGVNKLSLLHEVDDETWNWIIDVNLKGTFYCCKAVLPEMMKRKYGRIVNISSMVISMGSSEGQVPYASSKAGIVGLTRCLATEVAKYNILVNCVSPGFTSNPFLQKIYTEEQLQEKAARTLVGRGAETGEIANVVAFLASDEASYVTGSTVSVSGGAVLY